MVIYSKKVPIPVKEALFNDNPHVLWYPSMRDLCMVRGEGLRFYISIKLTHQCWFHRFPSGLMSTNPPHTTLSHEHNFNNYGNYWMFLLDARIIITGAMTQKRGHWFHLRPGQSEDGTWKGYIISPTCEAFAILKKLQLLLSRWEDRNVVNLHFSFPRGQRSIGDINQ